MSLDDIRVQMHTLSKDIHELDVDRHTAELAFANRLEGISTRAADLAVALQNYSPAPVPVPIQAVRYARFLHEVDTTFPIATQVSRWSLQVLQGDQWHQDQRAALRAIPGTTTLRASTPVARRPSDQPGDSTCLPPGKIPDAWMLRDSQGAIISRTRDGDQFVDVGHPDYQIAAANYLAERCARESWDGVWIDEVNADPRWSFAGSLPAKYPTVYRYQVAIRSFVNTVVLKLRSAGLKVWINLAGDYDDAWSNGLSRETDGHTIEFFIARGHEPTASLANGYFGQVLNWMTRREAEGTAGMYNAQTTDPALTRYALATFLLAHQGKGVFGAGLDPYGIAQTVWTADMDNARKLGAPKGPYAVAGGLYVRDFERGRVTVNPGTVPINTMPATSGLIELR